MEYIGLATTSTNPVRWSGTPSRTGVRNTRSARSRHAVSTAPPPVSTTPEVRCPPTPARSISLRTSARISSHARLDDLGERALRELVRRAPADARHLDGEVGRRGDRQRRAAALLQLLRIRERRAQRGGEVVGDVARRRPAGRRCGGSRRRGRPRSTSCRRRCRPARRRARAPRASAPPRPRRAGCRARPARAARRGCST